MYKIQTKLSWEKEWIDEPGQWELNGAKDQIKEWVGTETDSREWRILDTDGEEVFIQKER